MGRAPCCDKANVKKGPWSPEEDAKLKSYIEKHGTGGNWIALPQKIGLKRCGKSCRLRWLNYLRPNIKHGGFTEDEDNLICSLYISIGSRWSIIAAQLPGRTDNDIKNYWNTRLKKKLLGKQRRSEQPARPIINDCLITLNPRPLPLLVGYYESNENQLHEPAPNILVMPDQFEAKSISNNRGENYNFDDVFCAHHDQKLCKNQLMGSEIHYINNEVVSVNNKFPGFDGIPEEIMYSMPGGQDSFSAVDLVNCGTISSSSPENVNWGDLNPTVNYPSALNDSEACHQRMIQDWTLLFDEPRLQGYSQ